jgi:hypothetical protein
MPGLAYGGENLDVCAGECVAWRLCRCALSFSLLHAASNFWIDRKGHDRHRFSTARIRWILIIHVDQPIVWNCAQCIPVHMQSWVWKTRRPTKRLRVTRYIWMTQEGRHSHIGNLILGISEPQLNKRWTIVGISPHVTSLIFPAQGSRVFHHGCWTVIWDESSKGFHHHKYVFIPLSHDIVTQELLPQSQSVSRFVEISWPKFDLGAHRGCCGSNYGRIDVRNGEFV